MDQSQLAMFSGGTNNAAVSVSVHRRTYPHRGPIDTLQINNDSLQLTVHLQSLEEALEIGEAITKQARALIEANAAKPINCAVCGQPCNERAADAECVHEDCDDASGAGAPSLAQS